MNNNGSILRGILIAIGVLIVGAGLLGYFAYKSYLSVPIIAGNVRSANTVLVNGEPVQGTATVKQGDAIETTNGEATVTLYEQIIITLRKNTKITLVDMTARHPRVTQEKGSTLNQLVHRGNTIQYSISENGRTATVLGTTFELSIGKIITVEGTVSYQVGTQTFQVTAGKVVEEKNGILVERAMTAAERSALQPIIDQAIVELRRLRDQEIAKYPTLVNEAKQRFNITDEQIQAGLRAADEGQMSIDEILAKVPIRLPAIDRVAEITKAIQQLKKR